jgi:hypothetical protein
MEGNLTAITATIMNKRLIPTHSSFDLKNKTWFARIMNNGKVHRLGTFSTPEDASKAYIEAAKTFHTHNAVAA